MVEDDPGYRELHKAWLESEGYEAILAETLEEGFVGILTSPLPDLVLLDIHMGKKNGLTLVHWARRQRHLAQLQVAAVTGLACCKELNSIGGSGL